ncbi:hypothetical protein BDW75DRAFT_150534 [Aspergillus navahoensis]
MLCMRPRTHVPRPACRACSLARQFLVHNHRIVVSAPRSPGISFPVLCSPPSTVLRLGLIVTPRIERLFQLPEPSRPGYSTSTLGPLGRHSLPSLCRVRVLSAQSFLHDFAVKKCKENSTWLAITITSGLQRLLFSFGSALPYPFAPFSPVSLLVSSIVSLTSPLLVGSIDFISSHFRFAMTSALD